jgi:hypothetical protein
MENNRRGNTEMQSVMHELSHGSNAPKSRLKTDIILFAILVPLGIFLPSNYIQALGAVTTIVFVSRNWSHNRKMSEPKSEKIDYNNINRSKAMLATMGKDKFEKDKLQNIILTRRL